MIDIGVGAMHTHTQWKEQKNEHTKFQDTSVFYKIKAHRHVNII